MVDLTKSTVASPPDQGTEHGGTEPTVRTPPPGPRDEAHADESATSAAGGGPTVPLLVDPAVSRAKFDREIQHFRSMEAEYLRRGWILVRAEYPEAVVLFAAPQLAPPAVVFGVRLDFTNYDLWAPSVRFVKPFTLEPLLATEMPVQLLRRVSTANAGFDFQDLIPRHLDQIPFLCTRGVREYHHHPAHSNDPWLAYRGTGVGTMYYILNLIHRHGIAPLKQYALAVQWMIGFPPPDAASVPE